MRTSGNNLIPLNMIICDDDISHMSRFEELLVDYCGTRGIKPNISKYTSGRDLLSLDLKHIHILFLDIKLNEDNGVDIALALHSKGYHYKLIFVTELMTAEPRVVGVAFRYLPKSDIETNLHYYLDDAIDALGLVRTMISIKVGREDGQDKYERLFVDEILYIEVNIHTCVFHLLKRNDITDRKATSSYTLTQLEEMMPVNEFIKVSRKYLVRVDAIVNMANYMAQLKNGEYIKVSEKSFQHIRRRYLEIKGSKGML